jgi:hypothetical protein
VKLALAGLLALAPAAALAKAKAKPLPTYGTFVYSNLCWEKESGDAAGVRFALTRSRKGASLIYEYGNGPLEGARITRLKIVGDRIDAEASTNDGDLVISAILGPRRATLLGPYDSKHPGEPRTLKRIKSFKQKIPTCR